MTFPPRPGWWQAPPGATAEDYPSAAAFANAVATQRKNEQESPMAGIEAIELTRGTVGPEGPVDAGAFFIVPGEMAADDAQLLIRLQKAKQVSAADAKAGRKAAAEAAAAAEEDESAAPAPSRTGSREPQRTR
jgi:hypothetical protein